MIREQRTRLRGPDVRLARMALDMTQEELARRTGLCRTTISRLENGLKLRERHEQAIYEALMEAGR